MCTHIYTNGLNRKHPAGVACSQTMLGEQEIPHDKSGKCIFHSKDITWKVREDFTEWLKRLAEAVAQSEDAVHDFRDFVFVAEKERESVLEFGKGFFAPKRRISMNGALFCHPVLLRDAELTGGIEAKGAVFKSTLRIQDSTIMGADFTDAEFRDQVKILKARFSSYTYFVNAIFQNGLTVKESRFEGEAGFEKAAFQSENPDKVHTDFIQSTFCQSATFSAAVFSSVVFFDQVQFEGKVDFTHTLFDVPGVSQEHYQAVNFAGISIGPQAMMEFKGTSARKLFAQGVSFSFQAFEGILHFEHVQFFHIQKRSQQDLFALQRENKVVIGEGCIKYRVSYARPVTEEKMTLDIAQTFVNYFNLAETGINLGVEILPGENGGRILLYFSDADISQEAFLERLLRADEQLWQHFLAQAAPGRRLGSGESALPPVPQTPESMDVVLKAFFDRIRMGMLHGRDPEMYRQVMEATSLSSTLSLEWKEMFDKQIFNVFITNVVGDKNILSIANTNSALSPQIADTIHNIDTIDRATFY